MGDQSSITCTWSTIVVEEHLKTVDEQLAMSCESCQYWTLLSRAASTKRQIGRPKEQSYFIIHCWKRIGNAG
ncbi:hypothetical protein Bpfe_016866 [Biomphalaria pfeifferi]|uniref:Uncharacterized protein n=1 Tax=Biomphalaria pfeifferi TaxID=112525 RepID=A0AAD8F7V5_BIOPF|nr:hypothetical protein Bpfe_016866 [Biomphalaria pfeifferi]